MRILLLQLKRIGDFILTAPAVAALRSQWLDAEIAAVVPSGVKDLAECMPGLDRVLAYKAGAPNLKTWACILAGQWDLCLDFTGTDRSALMAWLSRAGRSLGYAKWGSAGWRARAYTELCDASVRDLHTVDFHLALVRQALPPFADLARPGTVLKVRDDIPCPPLPVPFCVVHIGTAREEKFWPAERWAEVIEHAATTHHVVLTGTNEGLEFPHLERLRSLLKVPFTDLTGQLTLAQLASLISRCEIAMGVDSMAMHLAAMFRRPQVVLFGPTNPFHWRPRQAHAVVVAAGHPEPLVEFTPKARGGDMNLISTSQVVSAMDHALSIS